MGVGEWVLGVGCGRVAGVDLLLGGSCRLCTWAACRG